VLETVNDLRAKWMEKHPETLPLCHDEYGNFAADEYANFLIGPGNMNANNDLLKKLCEQHGVMGKETVAVIGFSYLEDDYESPDKTRAAEFMDAHGLLLEL
jgi:hypothetical protein